MEPSQQLGPVGPYALRPEEPFYALGWVGLAVLGAYFLYRGSAEDRSLFLAAGSVAVPLGLSMAAVIAIRPLRPWRKVVRVTWTVLLLVVFVVVMALDVLSVLRRP